MLVARRNNDLMSTMFNELLDWNRWNNLCTTEDHTAAPKMNVSESDKDYQLELCIPGLKKEALNLSIDADNNYRVSFWMYRGSNYPTYALEGVKVWVNTTPDTIGGTPLIYIRRTLAV